jgi:hypothetical protein
MKTSRLLAFLAASALGTAGAVGCAPPMDDDPADPTTTAKPHASTVSTVKPTQPTMPDGVPCGWASGSAPAQWDHIVLVIFENKSVAQVFDPASPATYFKGLPAQCGYASNYWSVWTRSLANYLALTSGDTHGQTLDPPPAETPIAGDSIFQQLGSDWTVLGESATSNCQMKGNNLYNPRHIPSLYYTAIRSTCATRTIPLTDPPDLSRRFTIVIPNMINDMHVTDVTLDIPARLKAGDDWLRGYLPKLLATPEYKAGRTVILITFDEGQLTNSNIPLFVVSPYVNPGATETRRFTHYSLLHSMQEMMGLGPFLANAATAPSMRGGPLEL